MGDITIISNKVFFNNFVKNHKYVVLDCYADWCGPCKRIAPLFKHLTSEHQTVRGAKFNVDSNDELVEFLKVQAMPTFIMFKDGIEVSRFEGANEDKLRKFFEIQ